ncbi:hypothetical protein V8E54_000017 [Elaphomyces granulatus]
MRLYGISLAKGPRRFSMSRTYHLKALRVVNLDDQPLNRLIPEENIPSIDHPVYRYLNSEFSKAGIDDLKEFSTSRKTLDNNTFFTVFFSLAGAIPTRPGHIPGTTSTSWYVVVDRLTKM